MAENEDKKSEEQGPDFLPSKVVAYGPAEPVKVPSAMGATFAERASARGGAEAEGKAVGDESAENKSVGSKRAAKKS